MNESALRVILSGAHFPTGGGMRNGINSRSCTNVFDEFENVGNISMVDGCLVAGQDRWIGEVKPNKTIKRLKVWSLV